MDIYVVPLASLLLNFVAFAACLRFLFSRQGLYWLVPLAVTVFLAWPNAVRLQAVAAQSEAGAVSYTLQTLQPLLLSLLWYALIVTFHYALKKTVRENFQRDQMKKNLHEARYQQAVEANAYARRLRHRRSYWKHRASSIPERGAHSAFWADLFDKD